MKTMRCDCGWRAGAGPQYEQWAAFSKHDRAEHPGRTWFDWSDEGLIRYMATARPVGARRRKDR